MTTLHGTLLSPRSADSCEITEKAIVEIDADGKIAQVSPGATKVKDVVGGADCWILPGFIDAHVHLPQWDRRGLDGLDLVSWHEKVAFPAERRFEDAAFAQKLAREFITGVVACGTTTFSAFGSPFATSTDRVFSVLADTGVRALYGKMLNDTNCPEGLCDETDKALDESRELAAKWHGAEGGRLSYAFSPRAATCCSEKLLRGTAALADMVACYVQTHVGESQAEVAAVRESFPDQLDDTEVFEEMGLLKKRTLLGHGVCLGDSQRHAVAKAGTALVHCPTANLFLEAGLMDYVAHRRANVPLALGSSLAAGPEPFMPAVAVQALQTARAVKVHAIPRPRYNAPTAAEGWWLLTNGAAQALDMADRIGLIEEGKDADCLVVRPEPWIAKLPIEQRASALLYSIRPDQIEHVYVAGKRIGPK